MAARFSVFSTMPDNQGLLQDEGRALFENTPANPASHAQADERKAT